jgi:hypothetical protein
MVKLLVLVEGITEEDFVNEILASHLYSQGFSVVTARLIGNARQRDRRGGIRPWTGVRDEIIRHLKQDRTQYVSTMVDYYALPSGESEKAWPGRSKANELEFSEKALHVQTELSQNIIEKMDKSWNPQWFVPYIMMHEFESLLFSDCQQFASTIGREDLSPKLQAIRDKYNSPEEINDSPQTHPSQRILDLMPDYQKPLYGNLAAMQIGIKKLRKECLNFHHWLEKLENLPKN